MGLGKGGGGGPGVSPEWTAVLSQCEGRGNQHIRQMLVGGQ